MNYENATRLYTEALKTAITGDAENEIFTLMSHLRQSLSCYVCYCLLDQPCSNVESSCQHYVCQRCVGGKLRLPSGSRPTCSWCKDASKFQPDDHLVALLSCYGNLCRYVAATQPPGEGKKSLLDLISEGINMPIKLELEDNNDTPSPPEGNESDEGEAAATTSRKSLVKRRQQQQPKAIQTATENKRNRRRVNLASPVKSRLRSAGHVVKK